MREKKPLFFAVALGFSGHHRLLRLGDPVRADMALATWVCVLDYTRSCELDGHCPRAVVGQPHRQQAVADLLRVQLLSAYEKDGEHWLYLENYELLNETKAQIGKRLKQQRTWTQKSRNCQAIVRPDKSLSKALVSASQSQSQTDLRSPPVVPLAGDAVGTVAVTKGAKKRTSKPGTQVPPSGCSQAELEAWCQTWGLAPEHPKLERMLDWARAQGVIRKDWRAQWRNWLASPFADAGRGRQGAFTNGSYQGANQDEDPYQAQRRRRIERERDLLGDALQLVNGGVR